MSSQESQALKQSPLHSRHEALGAKFSEFGGWSMPLEYATGIVKEHASVREAVGVFDVSHLGKVLISGPGAAAFVNATLSNELGRIEPGQAQYTLCLDDETGGIVDDLIAYLSGDDRVLLVPNAANSAEVVRRLAAAAPEGVKITDHHDDYAVLAIQGTKSDELLAAIGLPADMDYMAFAEAAWPADAAEEDLTGIVVCRTGYTGERGYELIVRNDRIADVWDALMAAGEQFGVLPCGLGARDTLRTEMGYPLHGQDIGPDTNPLEGGVGWAVGWKKEAFWGRDVLLPVKEEGVTRVLRGLIAVGRGIPRPGMSVTLLQDVPLGDVTSGTFSPTLKKGIGLALLPKTIEFDTEVGVDVRGRREIFTVVKPPFVDTSVRES